MSIITLDDYFAATREIIPYTKTTAVTTVASVPFYTLRTSPGQPGAMVVSPGNTTTGVVPTSSTIGAPAITPFGVGNIGYLTKVSFSSQTASLLRLDDLLWYAGEISGFNVTTTTFTGNPSFSSRIPNLDYSGTEIWFEVTTAMTIQSPVVTVTYTNQDGISGRSTGAFALGSQPNFLGVSRVGKFPLQAGDSGVQSIQSVQVNTTSIVGGFNIMIVRPLWIGRVILASFGEINDFAQTKMPIVYDTSCLVVSCMSYITSSGTSDIFFEISNK